MIEKLEISGVKTDVTPEQKKYINKKIGRLDRFLSRHARKSAHAKVILKESGKGGKRNLECEVVLEVPGKTLSAKESTTNMFSSVDIVESKLVRQLRKYKEMHSPNHGKRLARKFVRKIRR